MSNDNVEMIECESEQENKAVYQVKMQTRALIVIVCIVAFSYFVFAPIEYYFSNIDEVWYDLYHILPITLVAFVLVSAFLMILLAITRLSESVLKGYGCLLLALSMGLYIQGNYVIIPYERLNGEAIDWSKYSSYNASSIIMWSGVICLSVVLFAKYWKSGKCVKYAKNIMICLLLTEIFSLVVIGIQVNGFAPKKELKGVTIGKWDYSSNQNMLILLMDTFDSRVLETALKEFDTDEMREYVNETFEDFTYYRDTMGAFSLTDYAVPQVISGESYLGGKESYVDYVERAYSDSPLLNELRSNDWSINIHSSTRMPQGNGAIGIENLKVIDYSISDYKEMVSTVYSPVNFRYFPTPLKQYAYKEYKYYTCKVNRIDGEKFESQGEYDYGADVFWDNNLFYYGTENIAATKKQNVMHFYHLKGIHASRDLNKDMEIVGGEDNFLSLEEETEVVIKVINMWLNTLREKGIYDNSIIVIMGDHGSVRYGGGHNYGQAPVLMIKGMGERKNFTISDAPVSYGDLQDIFHSLIAGVDSEEAIQNVFNKEGLDIFDYDEYDLDEFVDEIKSGVEKHESTGRVRKMIYHGFAGKLGRSNQGDEGYEISTEYPTYYGAKMQHTGNIYK